METQTRKEPHHTRRPRPRSRPFHLKGMGFSDEDLSKPSGSTHPGSRPCLATYNHRHLAEKVKQGVREAGGTPMELEHHLHLGRHNHGNAREQDIPRSGR